jgi:hypothetical protein
MSATVRPLLRCMLTNLLAALLLSWVAMAVAMAAGGAVTIGLPVPLTAVGLARSMGSVRAFQRRELPCLASGSSLSCRACSRRLLCGELSWL